MKMCPVIAKKTDFLQAIFQKILKMDKISTC